jgi:hypothetical protein
MNFAFSKAQLSWLHSAEGTPCTFGKDWKFLMVTGIWVQLHTEESPRVRPYERREDQSKAIWNCLDATAAS